MYFLLCFFIIHIISDLFSLKRKSTLQGSELTNELPRHRFNMKATPAYCPLERKRARPKEMVCCSDSFAALQTSCLLEYAPYSFISTTEKRCVEKKRENSIRTGQRQARQLSNAYTPLTLSRLATHLNPLLNLSKCQHSRSKQLSFQHHHKWYGWRDWKHPHYIFW